MDRLYYLPVTTPSNTPLATPQITTWALEDNELVYVDIVVPPGPSGLLGFRILWAQQQIVPWANNSFLVADDEKIHVDTNVDMTVTGLVIQTYNLDIFAHTIYLRALIRTTTPNQLLEAQAATGTLAIPAGLDLTDINPGIDTFTAGGYTGAPFEVDQGTLTDEGATDLLNPELPVETPTGSVGQGTNIPPSPSLVSSVTPQSNLDQEDYSIPEPSEFALAMTGG